jgi:hypothetical protein
MKYKGISGNKTLFAPNEASKKNLENIYGYIKWEAVKEAPKADYMKKGYKADK